MPEGGSGAQAERIKPPRFFKGFPVIQTALYANRWRGELFKNRVTQCELKGDEGFLTRVCNG